MHLSKETGSDEHLADGHVDWYVHKHFAHLRQPLDMLCDGWTDL